MTNNSSCSCTSYIILQAAASANVELEQLKPEIGKLVVEAAQEVLNDKEHVRD